MGNLSIRLVYMLNFQRCSAGLSCLRNHGQVEHFASGFPVGAREAQKSRHPNVSVERLQTLVLGEETTVHLSALMEQLGKKGEDRHAAIPEYAPLKLKGDAYSEHLPSILGPPGSPDLPKD